MTTPEQAARRWRQTRIAQSRRDVELETFPTTGGARSKNASPMYEQPDRPEVPVRYPGLVVEPPAPAGLTSWGTWSPTAIEHVGGGYHLAACNLISLDAGWYGPIGGFGAADFHRRWAIAIWLIRPDGTISDPWVSDGNVARPYTQGDGGAGWDAVNGPPYGEPVENSNPKLTRWQEGALLSFTILTEERQYVSDTSTFWPQSATELDVPYGGNVYRWVGHNGTDPTVGPALELYAGPDGDFPTSGDWPAGGGTEFDDGTTLGFEVVGPSADPNIAVYGKADNSGRHRIWLFDKDPADNTLSLAQRTTFPGSIPAANPGGLTRIAADRWVAMTSQIIATEPGMAAVLFDAKTGTVIDQTVWDAGDGFVDCYYLTTFWAYYAGNHLHYDGQAMFAAWWKSSDYVAYGHRHTTLTSTGDTLTAGEVVEWDADASFAAERLVETCQGCLRLVTSWRTRRQGLFEGRAAKAGLGPLTSPEFVPTSGTSDDQRAVPTSHPAGYMWASNVAIGDTWDGSSPIIPKLIRYPT